MLETCGFGEVKVVYEKEVDDRIGRTCVHARPLGHMDHEKILTRKKGLMSLFGGERRGRAAEKAPK